MGIVTSKVKLQGFNLVESDRCVHCTEPETVQHVSMEWQFFEEKRAELQKFINDEEVKSKKVAVKFSRMCKKTGTKNNNF